MAESTSELYKMIDPWSNCVYEVPSESIAYNGGRAIMLEYEHFYPLNRGDFSGDLLIHSARKIGVHGISEVSVVLLKLVKKNTNEQEYCWASRMKTMLPKEHALADGSGDDIEIGTTFLWPWSTYHSFSAWQQRCETCRKRGISSQHTLDVSPPSVTYIPCIPHIGITPLDIAGARKLDSSSLSFAERLFASIVIPPQSVYPRRLENITFEEKFNTVLGKRQQSSTIGRWWLKHEQEQVQRDKQAAMSVLSTNSNAPVPLIMISANDVRHKQESLRRMVDDCKQGVGYMDNLPDVVHAAIVDAIVENAMGEDTTTTHNALSTLRLTNRFFCELTNATVGAKIAELKNGCRNLAQSDDVSAVSSRARFFGLRVEEVARMELSIHAQDMGSAYHYVRMPPKIGNVLEYLHLRGKADKSHAATYRRAKRNKTDDETMRVVARKLSELNPNYAKTLLRMFS